MRIGLTGYATAGKDVVADVLVEEYGFVKVNMSDALDKYLQILNPYVPSLIGGSHIRYQKLREYYDYVEAKQFPEVRRLLQALGTEVGRSIDPDMWVKELEKEASKHEHVVTTGVRYPNEIAEGMTLIRVRRPGVGPINDHTSEDLEPVFAHVEFTIENDGTVEDLQARTRRAAQMLGLLEYSNRFGGES